MSNLLSHEFLQDLLEKHLRKASTFPSQLTNVGKPVQIINVSIIIALQF